MPTIARQTDAEAKTRNAFIAGVLTPLAFPVVAVVLGGPPLVVKAWAFTHLWTWYAEPMGAPPLGLGLAFGFCLMARLLTVKIAKPSEERYSILQQVAAELLSPLVFLFFGWLGSFVV